MTTRYYHGGPAGLTKILPPSVTGVRSVQSYGGINQIDRVYVTTEYQMALTFAALAPAREVCVYEVQPIFPLVDDPDCSLPGLSYECRAAIVLSTFPVDHFLRHMIADKMRQKMKEANYGTV